MQDVAGAPELGGNGVFQAITLPENGSKVVILPRWNIIALAKRPAALSVKDVSMVPEMTPPALQKVWHA
jgi:Rubisco Assembly chaperone C-terminal domain